MGWEFPIRISGRHGRVAVSRDKENIRQSVKIILLTEPGERLLHGDFGTRLHQFLFENMDSQTEEMIRREVCSALTRWEERIKDIEVTADMGRYGQGSFTLRSVTVSPNRERRTGWKSVWGTEAAGQNERR